MSTPGWRVFTSLGQSAAVAIPLEALGSLRHSFVEQKYWVAVQLDAMGFLSGHLPDRGRPLQAFLDAVEELRTLLRRLKAKGASTFVLGMDANLSLPADLPDLTGPCIHPWHAVDETEQRKQVAFLDCLVEFEIRVTSTWLSRARRATPGSRGTGSF